MAPAIKSLTRFYTDNAAHTDATCSGGPFALLKNACKTSGSSCQLPPTAGNTAAARVSCQTPPSQDLIPAVSQIKSWLAEFAPSCGTDPVASECVHLNIRYLVTNLCAHEQKNNTFWDFRGSIVFIVLRVCLLKCKNIVLLSCWSHFAVSVILHLLNSCWFKSTTSAQICENLVRQHVVSRTGLRISTHEHVSSGCCCIDADLYRLPTSCRRLTLMKNAACFNHRYITIQFCFFFLLDMLSDDYQMLT